jgi:ascorbate-specific PTS system EIIC-type component UlaA
MRTHLTRLRAALVLLLVGSGLLFLIGSTIERHQHHRQQPATAETSSGESGAEHAAESDGEAGVTILGVDTESLALSVLAVVASLVLACAVWFGRWTRLVLLAVAGFGLVFAAGDIRELVHQLNESNAGLAAIAAVLTGLHLMVTALAASLFPRRGNASGLTAAEPLT